MATYFSGSPVYTTDGVAILASFTAGGTTNTHFGYNLQIQKPMNSDVVTVYDIQGRVIFKSSCKAIDDVESILSNNKSRFSKSQHIISFGSNGVRQYRSIAVK
jgi:hypothetical protein